MGTSHHLELRRHAQLRQPPMSRYGTPASDLGRLALGGSSTSSSGDMPVTTRAMRRGHGGGSGSQQSSSSRPTAGPSRSTERTSGTQRGSQRARRAGGNGDDSDDDDDDDDSSSDDGEDTNAAAAVRPRNMLAAFEIAAALDQDLLAPRELMAATAQGNPQRRLADLLRARFQTQADHQALRGILSQAEALNRIENNFRKRYRTILSNIALNVENSSRGYTIVEGLRSLRTFVDAVSAHIVFYTPLRVLPDGGRGLVGQLMEMLAYITDRDVDLYATAAMPRAQYAGGGNTGNLFREFVREHNGILEGFRQLPVALLRERRQAFEAIIGKIRGHGVTNGDRAQYQQLLSVLHAIYERM